MNSVQSESDENISLFSLNMIKNKKLEGSIPMKTLFLAILQPYKKYIGPFKYWRYWCFDEYYSGQSFF